MITWTSFIPLAIVIVICWITASILALTLKKPLIPIAFTGMGSFLLIIFIMGLWINLDHPPMRTMGETRLWYSLFLSFVGVIIYLKWSYKWILSFTTIMASVFIMITLLKPELQNEELMPALQSPWFAPHVVVYMIAYAIMGTVALFAGYLLWKEKKHPITFKIMTQCDSMVQIAFTFLTLGLITGAIWAKSAWGHFWSWDPKETWAAITWLFYLVEIHYRYYRVYAYRTALWMIIIGFILLQFCWWGINYIPFLSKMSMHLYQ